MKIFFSIMAIGTILFCSYMAISGYIRSRDTVGIAQEAFNLINEQRAKSNLPALTWDNDLEQLAIKHSQYMNDTGDFSHSNYGYVENILKGAGVFSYGEQVYHPWQYSYLHYMNMMDSRIHYAAIGIVGEYATFLAK